MKVVWFAEDMARDLLSYKVPILVLGDLHQLPPVFGAGIFLQHPDAIFTKIMRQSEGSPIIYLSQLAIYHSQIYYGGYGNHNEARVIRKNEFLNDHTIASYCLSWADMCICMTNKMRDLLNKYVRERIQGIHSNTAYIGDKLICRPKSLGYSSWWGIWRYCIGQWFGWILYGGK